MADSGHFAFEGMPTMAKSSTYTAKTPDAQGNIHYSDDEHAVWADLIVPQRELVQRYACPEYIEALARLDLPDDHIPQCSEVSAALRDHTGWQVVPVPALIDFEAFFQLLAAKRFPAASFIRRREEMGYLQEPDIFHEIFGHAPLLTDPRYAAFVEAYGKTGLSAAHKDRVALARLFWFTVEFGLLARGDGYEVYGAGIVSSRDEIGYAVDSTAVERRPFDVVEVLRTPYRIDILQTVYYTIDSFEQLYALADMDLIECIHKARSLGMHPPTYEVADTAA